MMDSMFKVLDEHDAEEYRQWARKNYTPMSPISHLWHPIVRQECLDMNEEQLPSGLRLKPKQAAHRHCVHYFLSRGWSIFMEDMEADTGARIDLKDYHRIIDWIECVDGGLDFYVRHPTTRKLSWFGLAIGYGNQPDETIYDFSSNDDTNGWFKAYGEYWEQDSIDDSNHGVYES